MYHPVQQNEFVFVTLVTLCLIAISPLLALFAVLLYAIIRLRIF